MPSMLVLIAAAPVAAQVSIPYAKMEDVDPGLLSLDVYAPPDATGLPVMVYVHGGGWQRGDKANVAPLMEASNREGYVFVSTNYRLAPEAAFPAWAEDVATAIAWVHEHIGEYGGDPDRLCLMGHSAGAHIVALVATDETYLAAHDLSLSDISAVVPLDTQAYHIPALAERLGGALPPVYSVPFTDDPALWARASPVTHVERDKGIPPMAIAYSGGMNLRRPNARRAEAAEQFADALVRIGTAAEVVAAPEKTHAQIARQFGSEGDQVAEAVFAFLRRVLGTGEAAIRFERSYVAGKRDANGEWMGGTETMRLVSHAGMLFAAIGYWTDVPGDDPGPGGQILVKRGPDVPWEVDGSFAGSLRVNCMESLTFTTDHAGNRLDERVSVLLADAGLMSVRARGPLEVWSRDDETGEWKTSRIADRAPRAFVRAFGFHRDAKTGVDLVFAGTGAGEIYSGAYDPEAPGRLRWNAVPEYRNPDFDGGAFRRVQGFAVANGELHASVAPRIVVRADGAEPEWREVFAWEAENRAGAGIRGLTGVPSPDGTHEVLLGSRERTGDILRIDPTRDYECQLEVNSKAFLTQAWGRAIAGRLTAYNRFVPGDHPCAGEPIHWVTIAAMRPGDLGAAWLLIRNADASYEIVRVADPMHEPRPNLVSTRTIEVAPWSEREIYTGGYDGAANQRRNHNTAWIYRGILPPSSPAED